MLVVLGNVETVVQFVYIDETGNDALGRRSSAQLTLVAVVVPEEKVQPLGKALKRVAIDHLDYYPPDFEFHGRDLWHGRAPWQGKAPEELLAAYEDAIAILEQLELRLSHASIDKRRLHDRYGGAADENAYRLALQFLLEKVDAMDGQLKVVVADESRDNELSAVRMVADMQEWGTGEVPGRTLATVIDSLHYVRSHTSSGVQMADLVSYIHGRRSRRPEKHPNARAASDRMWNVFDRCTATWREPWPRDPR